MKVPKEIISYVRANVGKNRAICFIWEKNGVCCFSAVIPNCETGFPVAITLDDKGEILGYSDFESLDVISKFLR